MLHLNQEKLEGTGVIDDFEFEQQQLDQHIEGEKDLHKCHRLLHYEQKLQTDCFQESLLSEKIGDHEKSHWSSTRRNTVDDTLSKMLSTHTKTGSFTFRSRERDSEKKKQFALEKVHKVKVVRFHKLQSFICLKKAEDMLMSSECRYLPSKTKMELIVLTLNNLGCFYKKARHNTVARQHFTLVLDFETRLEVPLHQRVNTMLNIAACLSNQKNHTEAVMIICNCLVALTEFQVDGA